MALAVHFLCRMDGTKPLNSRILQKPGGLELGWWAMSSQNAESLVGGWAYLHSASSEPSYAAYRVEAWKPGTGTWTGRLGFDLLKAPSVKAVRWRGQKAGQNPRENYRIVNGDLQHEIESLKDGRSEVILSVGFEGGSLTLFGIDGPGGWRFFHERDESTMQALLYEEDAAGMTFFERSAEMSDLEEALVSLDRWHWYDGYPACVHPSFARQIMTAVAQRASRTGRVVGARWDKVGRG